MQLLNCWSCCFKAFSYSSMSCVAGSTTILISSACFPHVYIVCFDRAHFDVVLQLWNCRTLWCLMMKGCRPMSAAAHSPLSVTLNDAASEGLAGTGTVLCASATPPLSCLK